MSRTPAETAVIAAPDACGGREPEQALGLRSVKNRLRVLIVEPQNVGGMWHYAFSLTRALAQADFQTVLATVFPFEDLGDSGDVHLCAIGTDMLSASPWPIRAVQRTISHLDKLNRLRRIIAELRPDIVHLHNPLGKLDFLYFRLLKAWGVGVVYTAHDATPLQGQGHWFDWARYRAADAILVHSSGDVTSLLSKGVDESKITIIPHGNYLHYCPDPDPSREHAKLRLGIPAPGRVILFFGAIKPYKGLDLLIEAFSRLGEDAADTYLVIAGAPFEDVSPYRRRIHELHLSDRIVFDLRYIPFAELPKYFSASDLVAFPYRRISQSGVLHLAYAYGRPVVVTNVGGLAEAVTQDCTGVIAMASDAASFSAAIRKVLSDPEEAARMGARGRSLADTKYSWGAITEKIANVYRSVRRRSSPG